MEQLSAEDRSLPKLKGADPMRPPTRSSPLGSLRPVNPIAQLLARNDAPEAGSALMRLKAELESHVERYSDDYVALVLLGEINLRIGLAGDAQRLLYRASLIPPPDWATYQRTSYLLRRAEEQQSNAFARPAGAAPPFLIQSVWPALRALLRALAGKSHSVEAPPQP
jgi:hypothetical protein